MSNVRRVYVEKKGSYDVQQKALAHEIRNYLGIKDVEYVRILNRYDVENVSDETFERACNGIFAEPPVDVLWKEEAPVGSGDSLFSVEFLPGQFDQRADSAVQCIQFVKEDEQPVIRTATTYIIHGKNGAITEEELQKIKEHCINPVDSREAAEEKPETLVTKFDEPADVIVFDGFKDMEEEELKKLYDSLGLAMTFRDFQHIQNHFKGEEHRDPSMTEIRVLDTYWSDHCRHTTFSTELTEVSFGDGDYRKPMEDTYKQYLRDHSEIFKGREDKFVCLMDLALMAMRKLKKEGKYEVSKEAFQKAGLEMMGGWASPEDMIHAMSGVYETCDYLMDPHTAVAYAVYDHLRREGKVPRHSHTVIISTAHPYKFPGVVAKALGLAEKESPYDTLREIEESTGIAIPKQLGELETRPKRFTETVDRKDMADAIRAYVDEIARR